MEIVNQKIDLNNYYGELLTIGITQGQKLPPTLRSMNNENLDKFVKKEAFEGKTGQMFSFTREVMSQLPKSMVASAGDYKPALIQQKIILYGLGEQKELILDTFRRMAGVAVRSGKGMKASSIAVFTEQKKFGEEEVSQAFAEGLILANYKPTFFKTSKEDEFECTEALIIGNGDNTSVGRGVILASAQNYVREINENPGNIVTPFKMGEFAKEIGKKNRLTVTVFEKDELKKKGMNAILAVAQGSINPPVLVSMEYNRDKKNLPLYAIVGKGVTFDSGGISIKPSKGMQEMKYDKTGACITIGVMKAIAELKLPVRVIGIFASVENMPSGNAQRPGDIIKSYGGKTIEVLNTDAEGRLILADTLAYACEKKPELVIDLATLTGAIVVCLGSHAIGMFSNDDKLALTIENAGINTHERVWRMPIWKEYAEMIKADFADIKNIGSESGDAGSITAAMFLKEFIGDTKWAHLDIAGVDNSPGGHPYFEKGATGIGLRLVVKTIENLISK